MMNDAPTIVQFKAFARIPRLSRECVITEKIDGTNGQIYIDELGLMRVGSRSRWLSDKEDNHGFWRWCMENQEQLIVELGIGRHYGEWWGAGIQRRYAMKEKQFSLFNTTQWKDAPLILCRVVPVLYTGEFCTAAVNQSLDELAKTGSKAAPGYMDPEGVVIYHTAGRCLFKKTIKKDEGKEL